MSSLRVARHIMLSEVPREDGAAPTASLPALTPRGGSVDLAAIRQIAPGGEDGPPHKHDCDEIVVMIAGNVEVDAEEETIALAPGDALLVPADRTHRMRNVGNGEAHWFIISRADRRFLAPNGDEVPMPDWAQ